jgi:hypothetical protein
MPDSTHMRKQGELQEKYRCESCSSNGYCWPRVHRLTGKQDHIEFDGRHLSIWASAILASKAYLDQYPIHIQEFAELWERKEGKGQKKGTNLTTTADSDRSIIVTVNNQLPAHPEPPSTPIQKPRNVVYPSPVPGVAKRDYSGDGLLKFLDWVDEEYGTFSRDFTYEALRRGDIGLDHLKLRIDPKEIEKECGLKYSAAMRLLHAYGEWDLVQRKMVFNSGLCKHGTDF